MLKRFTLFFILFCFSLHADKVKLGIDVFLEEGHAVSLQNKRVGLVTNHTGLNKDLVSTIDLFKDPSLPFTLTAIFSPEHGVSGNAYAGEHVPNGLQKKGPVIFSLHGNTRRPTSEMLKAVDVIVFDMQEIGVRPYTYAATLFYAMEEAAKHKIPVVVLDRPNPLGGLLVDGPMLEDKWRSFLGYINVPYCHGMTIGELARFFNEEYHIGCDLKVIPMKGWKRNMTFTDTGLQWVPTSPNIPEADTPFYFASTGLLGELGIVNIGVGYTLPFKVVGAPWIRAETFCKDLNAQNLPGVKFIPFYYRPMFGSYKNENCEGVKILITNPSIYRPLSVQYLLIGMLKNHYPQKMKEVVKKASASQRDLFCKANGNEYFLNLLEKEKYVAWKMISYQDEEKKQFLKKRERYLLY